SLFACLSGRSLSRRRGLGFGNWRISRHADTAAALALASNTATVRASRVREHGKSLVYLWQGILARERRKDTMAQGNKAVLCVFASTRQTPIVWYPTLSLCV